MMREREPQLSPVPHQESAEKQYKFYEPGQVLSEIIREQREGLRAGFSHEIGNAIDMPMNAYAGSLERVEFDADHEEAARLRNEIIGARNTRLLFEAMQPLRNTESIESVSDLEQALEATHHEADGLANTIDQFLSTVKDDERFMEGETERFAVEEIRRVAHNPRFEALRIALKGVEQGGHVSLAERLQREIEDTVTTIRHIRSPNSPELGKKELQLFAAITGTDPAKMGSSHVRREALEKIRRDSEDNPLDLLQKRGFALRIDLPSDYQVNSDVYEYLLREKMHATLADAVLQSTDQKEPAAPLNGYLHVTLDDKGEGPEVVFRYPVREDRAVQMQERMRQAIARPAEGSKDEGAWGPFFERLAFDRHKRRYYDLSDLSLEDDLSLDKKVAVVRLPIIPG